MLKGFLGGAAIVLAALTAACAPPPVELVPPQLIRVDHSYACVESDSTNPDDPDGCVFWRNAAGEVFFGPFSMVQLPPSGTDVIIPPPVIELPLGA
jgi:hypothetical protein